MERHDSTRRRMLRGTVGLGTVALTGCLGGGEETPTEAPDPIALADGQICDVCGMMIAEGYGPNGQVAYDGEYPPDRDGPAPTTTASVNCTPTCSPKRTAVPMRS